MVVLWNITNNHSSHYQTVQFRREVRVNSNTNANSLIQLVHLFFLIRQSVSLFTQSTPLTISLRAEHSYTQHAAPPHTISRSLPPSALKDDGQAQSLPQSGLFPLKDGRRERGEPLPLNNWYQMLPSNKGVDPWAGKVPGHLTAELEDRQTAVFCQPAPAEDPPPSSQQWGNFQKKNIIVLTSFKTKANCYELKSFKPLILFCLMY